MRLAVRSFAFSSCVVLAPLLVASSATAADPPPIRDPQPIVIKREQLGVSAAGDAARARMRKGDCAGALEAFDQAIARTIEPTLRRDRGLCHERLGNPYPAIDDFRAYLAAQPDAADADDIRMRLERLEEQVGVGGPSGKNDDKPSFKASVAVSSSGDGKGGRYDSARLDEMEEDMPIRRGRGLVLTPFVGVRHWFAFDGVSASAWSETAGVRLNYWLGPVSSLFAELGYERFNTTSQDGATIAGLSSQLGYEARLPVKKDDFDNFWMLGFGLGYESLWVTQTGSAPSLSSAGTASFGAVLGRGRFGYRHNLSPRTGIEVSLDGAVGNFFVTGGSGSGKTVEMIGLNLGLVFGL
jgi:hypothetical protein